MIYYSHCPVCKSDAVNAAFSATDYTVSHEHFTITKCNQCTAMFTQDVPGQEAIGRYYASDNYISHSNTRKGFINNLYHIIRKRTLNAKRKLIKAETGIPSGKILDVGCGTGAFLECMRTGGWNITGLEPDEAARKNAGSFYNIHPMASHEIFYLPPDSFDAITMWHVLEHVHQLHEYLGQLKSLLTAKGKLFIAVPNYTSYDAQHYKEYWAAYDVPRHLYHFSPYSMRRLMHEHGLSVRKIKPMWFDSFYVSMLSEKYRNGKGSIIKAFFTGLVSNIKALSDREKCSSVIYIISKQDKY
jgi:2-polyprenyl-3-methyl-5-hydroxy-6-metoxy-1,4-benzoquinol methylase